MSLSKIGKLQSTIKNAQITDGLISTLKSMDIKAAAPALKFTSLSADKRYTAMAQAYGTDAAKNNAAAAGVYAVSKASEEATSSVSGLSAVFTGLFSVVKSLLPVLIPVASIIGGKMLFDTLNDKYTITKGMATKHYNQAVETYDTDKSDLESLTSEYSSNKERIYELREKENKSQSENLELSQLQSQNEMLHTQVTAKEALVKLDKKRKQETAKADLEHSVGSILDESNPDQPVPKSIDEIDEITNSINNQAEGLKTLIDKKNELIQENKKLEEQGDTSSKKYLDNASDITDLDSDITQKQSSISEAIGKVNEKAADLYNDDGTIDDNYKALAERVQNLNDEFLKLTDTSNTDDKINNIFTLSDYADLQDKLTELGKKRGSKGINEALKDDNTYSSLLSALEDKNVSTEDLTDYIMSIADPEAKNIEGIKQNLKDEFAYNKNLNKFFKDKSDTDIEGFWDYYQSQGFDAEEYNWKKKDLSDNWDKYLKTKEKTKDEGTPFSSLFKNATEDTASDIDTVTDNFQTDIGNIKSAMDKLRTGEMKNSDITDLIQQFPELADETDDLQTGLQKIASGKTEKAIGKIRDAVKDTTDPKELAKADRYVQSIMDNFNTSGLNMSNAKDDVIKRVRSNLKGSEFLKDNAENTLNKLFDTYANDEVAKQAIVKLSMDPSMANASLSEWTSKIHELRPQIELDVSTKNLEDLSNDLTRLQTQASNTQTEINNKASFNQKTTAKDYEELYQNGNDQIKNLQDSIKEYQTQQKSMIENSLLPEDTIKASEDYKKLQDNIDAANMSIENMKASQAGWIEDIQNLPITDVTNLASALSTAISETNGETGLTTDSIKNLKTQFSDLTAQGTDISGLFTRSAKGLELNTNRFQDLMETQDQFVRADYADDINNLTKSIEDYQNKIGEGNTDAKLESMMSQLDQLKNLRAEYMAQYEAMQSQLSDFQIMQNSKNAQNAGDEYTQAKSDLEAAKELYDKGLVGTEQFKKTAKYFSQGGFEDADNFIENYDRLKKYYTDDASGPKAFLEDLQSKGMAAYQTLEDGSKAWTYSFNDTQDAADQMGMSLESFNSLFGRLEDYGFINNFVESVEDGQNKVDNLTDKLVTEQEKLSKLKANGASQQALDDQQAVVEGLQSQISNTQQATQDYAEGTTQRKINDLKEAKQIIDDFNDNIKNASSEQEKQGYKDRIKEIADKNGIKLKINGFEVDENAYNQMMSDLETQEKSKKIKEYQDINNDLQSGKTVENGDFDESQTGAVDLVNKINEAKDKNNDLNQSLQQIKDTTSQLTNEEISQLSNIQLSNGAYDNEAQNLHDAEDALQGFADKCGLSKEQAADLLPALQALGIIKVTPDVDTSKVDSGSEEIQQSVNEGMSSLRELQSQGDLDLTFSVDTDIKGLSLDELDSQIEQLKDVQVNFDVNSSEYQAIQSMIDDRTIQKHVQILLDQNSDISTWLNMSDQDLALQAGIDLNDSDAQSKIEALKSSLQSLSDQQANISVRIDQTQFDQLLGAASADKATITVDANNNDAIAKINEAKQKADSAKGKITVNADTGPAMTSVMNAISTINSQSATIKVNADASQVTSSVNKALSGSYSINVAAHVTGLPSGGGSSGGGGKTGKRASGTMTSVAHANGTAYNVINYKPLSSAHADGNVGLPNDELALTNELGTESIVRDGVWSLLPGGPHFESLKKGDIIFSASQTKALLERGKAFGHARAYAQGTLDMLPAHANNRSKSGPGGGDFSGGASNTKSNNSNGSSGSTPPKTTTKSGGGNTQKSSSTKNLDKYVDWFERLVTKFTNSIDLAMAQSENATSLASQNRYLTKAIKDNEYLQKKYKRAGKNDGIDMYTRFARQFAGKIQLTKTDKKLIDKIQNGKLSISEIKNDETRNKISAYQKWYDKIAEGKKAYEDLKAKEKELHQQKLDNIVNRYDALKGVYENITNMYASKNEWRSEIGSSKNITTKGKIDKNNSDYYNNLIRQKNGQDKQTYYIQKEINEYKSEMAKIRKKYGPDSTIYKQAESTLNELTASLYNSKKASAEFKNQIDELAITLKQYQVDKYNRAIEKESSYRDFKKNNDLKYGKITENDYSEAIKSNNSYIEAVQAQKEEVQKKMLTIDKTSDKYQEYANQVAEFDKNILNAGNNTAELKKELLEVKFDAFNDAQDNIERIISDVQNLQDMLDSDTFMNDDGSFTKQGLASITLVNKEMEAQMQKISDYEQHLKDIQELYKNGYYDSEEQYEQARLDAIDKINSASKSLYSSQQNMIKMYTDQISKENEYLQDNIDKRQDALDAKKDYYDYNKTLKDKNKDINALKAQIAALEGTTNAASKAKLEKLKADLKDKEDDLADTKYDHQIDMESKGYDNLKDQTDDALDKTLTAVKSNSELQKSIIDKMLKEVKNSYKEAYGEIEDIIKQTGYHTSDWYNKYLNEKAELNNNTLPGTKPGSYTGSDGQGGNKYTGDKAPSISSGAQIGINGAIADSKNHENASSETGLIYNHSTGKYEKSQKLTKITVNGGKSSIRIAVDEKVKLPIIYNDGKSTPSYKNYTVTQSNKGVVGWDKKSDYIILTGKKSGKSTLTFSSDTVNSIGDTVYVVVTPKDYDKYAKAIDKQIAKKGIVLTESEQNKLKDNILIGKSDKTLSAKGEGIINDALQKKYYAQEKVKDKYTNWKNNIKNHKYADSTIKKQKDELKKYYMEKGKHVTDKQFVSLANSVFGLGYSKDYKKWTSAQKAKLVEKLKLYKFARGGVVRNLIPADLNTMIGHAIMKNGDTGFITANPGETVLTEEFTKQLRPTVAAMNEFTGMMNKGSGVKNLGAVQSQTINYNPEINVNVGSISNDVDIDKLGKQLSDVMFADISKKFAKDFKKTTGRNR